ncbi:MAG: endolytic transglycosylase MltG [Bacteroides sp.]|nr:endolytic transglycosylase MltG [Bacteroides sp.]
MNRRTRKILIGGVILLLVIAGVCAGTIYYYLFAPQFHPKQTVYVYIDRDDTIDSIYNKVKAKGMPNSLTGFRWMAQYRDYAQCIHTGRYAIRPDENVYHIFSRLYRGYQEPMNLTIGSVRTLDRLARSVGKQLMIDSAEIARALNDSLYRQRLGYTQETLPALFIPETYQVYWDMSVDDFFDRMKQEHERFWNEERLNKARALNMTPIEVSTLASIVEEETNNNAEKPMVAGLYINRLQRKMPLQADPTVKFALQDFGLRRITNQHLNVKSPYNTYQNPGLPPGPIRIPSPVGLDAVLNYTHHNYIYMCAKEDFSGTHNFAATYAEHTRNARKYWNALNERKIFK